jgi:hypothetical protein
MPLLTQLGMAAGGVLQRFCTCGAWAGVRALLNDYGTFICSPTEYLLCSSVGNGTAMKKYLTTLVIGLALLSLASGCASTGRKPGGRVAIATGTPTFSGTIVKLMGSNTAFSARVENEMYYAEHRTTLFMPGEIFFDQGKSRFECDKTETERKLNLRDPNAPITGTEKVVTIKLPDTKRLYTLYPDLKVYSEQPDRYPFKPESDFQLNLTEQGRETVDGHPCLKCKVVGRDGKGTEEKSIVWLATDMNNFPIQIESDTAEKESATTRFKDLRFGKPDPAKFEVPPDFKRYDGATLADELAKRAAGKPNSLPEPAK